MSLARKIEQAMEVVMADGSVEVPIHLGQTDDRIVLPCVIIRVAQAQEEPHGTGNFRVIVEVAVRHTVDDDPDNESDAGARLNELTDLVQETVHADDLADLMNAAGIDDFTVIGIGDRTELSVEYEGRFFESVRAVEMMAAEMDLIG